MKYRLIAFTGKQGSGKTTATDFLMEALPVYCPNFRASTVKFAQPIYNIMYDICSRTNKDFDKTKLRPLMQYVGTFFRNSYGEDFWINLWELEVKSKLFFSGVMEQGYEDVILVDDLRYDNEAIKIKSLGGFIVQVNASTETRAQRLPLVGTEHPPEQGIDPRYVDATIDNNCSLQSLRTDLVDLIRAIK